MMGGGGSSPRPGFEGAGAPRQPQCLTLGRLAPLYYALRTGPAVPAPRQEARPDPLPPLPENATAWQDPIPDGEVPSLPPPPPSPKLWKQQRWYRVRIGCIKALGRYK